MKIFDYWINSGYTKTKKVSKEIIQKEITEIREAAVTYADKKQIPQKIKEIKAKYKMGDAVKKDLTFLKGEDMYGYLFDMVFCQYYASINRKLMAKTLIDYFKWNNIEQIETVHNYINFEDMIVRKGAISAHDGERVIIPFNMQFGLVIAKGKGNGSWNWSAPHGAGRLMSRGQAKKNIDLEEFKESMKGINTWCVGRGTLDESPMAYKDPQVIIDNISETVDIQFFVKPTFNFKDSTEQPSWAELRKKMKENK